MSGNSIFWLATLVVGIISFIIYLCQTRHWLDHLQGEAYYLGLFPWMFGGGVLAFTAIPYFAWAIIGQPLGIIFIFDLV